MASEPVSVTVPEGNVVYAIGDIHGRSDLLSELLRLIEQDAAHSPPHARKTLVFLGDYVDRGPDSRGVIEKLCHGLPHGFEAVFLKGNHEEILLEFLDDPTLLGSWRRNGGERTLESYGVDCGRLARENAKPAAWRDAFASALPPAHVNFLRHLRLTHEIGDYAFVHAGVRPGVPLDAQDPADLLWIRDEFLTSQEPFGKIVVHGHTPGACPVVRSNRIGIDTGAVFSEHLTALRLEDGRTEFLRT